MRKLTQEEFINKVTIVNSVKNYDYSLVEYTDISTKVRVICPFHGEFQIRPDHLSVGHGCRLCRDQKRSLAKRTPKADALKRLSSIVDPLKYDLSKVEYVSNDTPVVVICKEHGEFLITPRTLFRGCGCRQCFLDSLRDSQDDFINKARDIRPEYDYSLVKYKDSRTKVKIICPEHGAFSIAPCNLLNGQGCSSCFSVGFDKNRPGLIYIYKVDGIFSFTGFGITRNIKRRSDTHKASLRNAGCFTVEQYKSDILSGELILNLETLLKQTFPLAACSRDIPGFKRESTTADYATVVAFVQNYIAEHNNKQETITWQPSTLAQQQIGCV